MEAKVLIMAMTNGHQDFYSLVGPFLSRRSIVAEIGAPIWDDDDKQWFVARCGSAVVGIAALVTHNKSLTLVSVHVVPEYRRRGVSRALVAACLDASAACGLPVRAVAGEALVRTLKQSGFRPVGARGRFTTMEFQP